MKGTRPTGFRLAVLLFFLAFLSSTIAYPSFSRGHLPRTSEDLLLGITFSIPLFLILLAHELGHFVTARIYGLEASYPYFIPAPNMIGTMGAIILMRGRIPHRTSILETGAMGPIAGFVVAIPLYLYGIAHSQLIPLPSEGSPGGLKLGDPLIARFLTDLVWGPIPEGMDLSLHPVAFAGWVGFLVTSLNLLPVGQLDGGHVIFGLLPRLFPILSRITVAVLVVMGYLSWIGWGFWAIVLILVGFHHPSPIWNERRLLLRTRILGILALIIFFLTFMPNPFPH